MADTPLTSEVPVINPSGEFVYIPADRLQEAVKMGYSPMTPQDVKAKQLEEEYSGPKGAALATLAGAARGLSIGASDLALTKTGLVEPETLKALKEAQPALSTIADVGGSLIGAGKLKALGVLPKAVAGAGRAAQALVPAAAEGSGLASQVLRGAGRTALGSSVEGAIYGAGQAVSESALEDKELTAEALASGIGFGAALGGGFGAALGAGGTVLQKLLGKVAGEAAELASVPKGSVQDVESALQRAGIAPVAAREAAEDLATSPVMLRDAISEVQSPDLKQGIFSGLGQVKKNAAEIREAADFFGAKVSDGMISASPVVQKAEQAIMTGPSIIGDEMRKPVLDGIRRVSERLESTVGQGPKLSLDQLGSATKDFIKKTVAPGFEVTEQLYNELKPYEKAITLNQRSKNSIARSIGKIIEEDSLIKGTPEHQFISTIAAGAKQMPDTLEGLYRFQSNVSSTARGTNNPSLNYLAGRISEKLDTLANTSVRSFAEGMKTPEAKNKILSLLDQVAEVDKKYAKEASKAGEFLKQFVGARSKFRGPKSFSQAIDALQNEDVAKWAMDRKNVQFQKFLEKEAPEAWQMIRDTELKTIRDASLVKGEFNPNAFIRQVEKLEPEYRAALFGKEAEAVLKNAKIYLDALPPNFNPSGTASMTEYFEALSSPLKYATAEAQARIAKTVIGAAVNDRSSMVFSAIKKLEEKTKATVKRIQSDSSAIFTVLPRAGTTSVLKAPGASDKKSEEERKKEYEKAKEEVKKITTGGQASFDNAENAASSLYAIAPEVTSTLQMTAMKGASFLASKLQESPDHPLDGKMPESPAQINKFLQYYSAVKDPVGVLARVKDGTITGADLETLNYVYPRLYATMKTQVQEALVNYTGKKDKKKLPYRTQMALSAFLGMDLSPSLSPQAVADYQMTHAMPNRASDSQVINPTQGGMSQITASNRAETPTQAVASGRNNA